MEDVPTSRWRIWALAAVAVGSIIAIWVHGPIAQNPAYHLFADHRTVYGIPNFWNVASNLPFLLAGVVGLLVLGIGSADGILPSLRRSYAAVFIGSALVAVGSAYYHIRPNNTTLAFDRLPMTLVFMAFLSVIVGEHIVPSLGRRTLFPFLLLGVASVLWWRFTDSQGHGDLRLYVLVQYLPGLLIPIIVALFPSRLTGTGLLWGVLAGYALAKGFEALDVPLYELLGVSGHTLKHLATAAALFLFVVATKHRRPRDHEAHDPACGGMPRLSHSSPRRILSRKKGCVS